MAPHISTLRQALHMCPFSTRFLASSARCFSSCAAEDDTLFKGNQGQLLESSNRAALNYGTKSSQSFPNAESRLSNVSRSRINIPSRPNVFCKQPPNPRCSSSFMALQRQFASKSRDSDEDIIDDVESRLIGDDYNRGGYNMMGDTANGMSGAMYDDYGEENEYGEDVSWTTDGKTMEGLGEKASGEDDGDDGSDEDDDEGDQESGVVNEPSDEEFEEERTDDELDELLANTPLFDPPELEETGELDPDADFHFRPEGPVYYPGMEYEPEELDVTRPLPPRKREPREKEVVTVQEAIDKADFRNVRFLTRFIGETGNILARREFNMRNKSHGRITKAIKTARFFGLMPYTNMGRPKYVFNEPFDEFSEFYETDDDEKKQQEMAAGPTYEASAPPRFRRFPQRPGGFGGQGVGRRYYHKKLTAGFE